MVKKSPKKPPSGLMSLLRNEQFLQYWLGSNFSALGDGMVQVLLLGALMKLSGFQHADMTRLICFTFLPFTLFSISAGILLDRYSRTTLLIWSALLRGLLIGLMALGTMGPDSVPAFPTALLYGLFFLHSAILVGFHLGKVTLLPRLVQDQTLGSANAFRTGTDVIAQLLGNLLPVFLFSLAIPLNIYALSGICYLISALSFVALERQPPAHPGKGVVQEFKTYLASHHQTRRWLLVAVALSLLASFFYISLNQLSFQHFHLSPPAFKRLLWMLDAGMVAGALLFIALGRRIKIVKWLAGAFGVVFFATFTASYVHSFFMAYTWLILLGVANAILLILLDTLFQRTTPNRYLGTALGIRFMLVNGVFLTTLLGLTPLLNDTSPFLTLKLLGIFSLLVVGVMLLLDAELLYFLLSMALLPILRLFFSFEVEGKEHLRVHKVILAGNHTGFLDASLLIAGFGKPLRFLVAQKVFAWPIVGWLVRMGGMIAVAGGREKSALSDAIEALKAGGVIGIFPEGKLSVDGQIGEFQRGVAVLQKHSRAPIIPFVIHGGFEAWPWRRWLPRPRKVILQFGQPILPTDREDSEVVSDLRDRVRFMKTALERRERAEFERVYQESVLSLMLMKSDVFGARAAIRYKAGGSWQEITYIELSRRARRFSDYLIENGIQRGDRIAILSEGRPEWGISLFAAIRAGALIVPLDTKLTAPELTTILQDATPRAIVFSNPFQDVIETVVPALASQPLLIRMAEEGMESPHPALENLQADKEQVGRDRDIEEDGILIYTSGTTGAPKGVVIPFRSIIFEARALEIVMGLNQDDVLLSMLPLNHLLELTCGFLSILHAGGKISYAQTLFPQEILTRMAEEQITYMITVPLFLNMLKAEIERNLSKRPQSDQAIFRLAYGLSRFIPFTAFKKRLFRPIHQAFGERFRGFVSGGAPLSPEVETFLDRLGIPVYQGYGLSETGPVITVNTPTDHRLGTVGQPMPEVEVRIRDGEILTRGPHLMSGYYQRPDLTAEVLDADGWFHTGDLGHLDPRGYLHVTGRLKNLIVLGGGKKVFPEEVEEVLAGGETYREICILGRLETQAGIHQNTETVCAVVVPSDSLKQQAEHNPDDYREAVRQELERLGQALAPFKRPTRIEIYPGEFPRTSSRKIKRAIIMAWINEEVTSGC